MRLRVLRSIEAGWPIAQIRVTRRTAASLRSIRRGTNTDGIKNDLTKTSGRCVPVMLKHSLGLRVRFAQIPIFDSRVRTRLASFEHPCGIVYCTTVDKQRSTYLGDAFHSSGATVTNGLPPTARAIFAD